MRWSGEPYRKDYKLGQTILVRVIGADEFAEDNRL